ncbi:acyl-CoA dehydrogenase family protein [Nocardia miyunensis]|uniref:acyl-CoA dehydrogenase family protein n=1 Tax=Nocardia miyunensis TaxID=282684 RepID=UPI00082E5AD7|nr:acyl-CoA dehydrogenase family protein [Nocardia miyunensis]
MSVITEVTIAQPEPGLTPDDLVQRARELRPRLLEEQAAVEERGTYSPEMHELFREAGFYRILQPRRFGGYEFDITTYARVISEIARGCPSSAWCLALASAHVLLLAAWFPESAQIEAFSPDGEFAASTRAIPGGTAQRLDGGWKVDGKWDYCSGSPYSTHAMVWAKVVDETGSVVDETAPLKLVLVPRSDWTSLDNWRGSAFGMRGSGSNSIRIDGAVVPDHFVLDDPFPLAERADTVGYRMYGNSMYVAPPMMFAPLEITAVLVGCARAALDEYERILVTKKAPVLPDSPTINTLPLTLSETHDFQRWYGLACGRVEAAETLLVQTSERLMAACREATEDGAGFSATDIFQYNLTRQQAINLGWEAVDLMFRTSGTSEGGRNGSRMNRYTRDYLMGRTNIYADEEKFAESMSKVHFAAGRNTLAGNA